MLPSALWDGDFLGICRTRGLADFGYNGIIDLEVEEEFPPQCFLSLLGACPADTQQEVEELSAFPASHSHSC